jgi:hypothetical protein
MADVVYRGNLKASSFPLLSELFGRSIIVKGQDQNYIQPLAAKEVLDAVTGVPQIYYCHNVLPTNEGYKSVGYVEFTAPAFPSTSTFGDVNVIRSGDGNSCLMTVDSVGNIYLMQVGSSSWAAPTTGIPAATIAGSRVTIAYVSGISYIYFAGVGCYIYDFGTDAFVAVTLVGLTPANINGVVGNSGYLIAYDDESIAWSSTVDPTQFTPSLTTGAGTGSVEGLRGAIVTIEEVYGGLVVFGDDNAVAATYSGNPRYPYNFTAIQGCGGLQSVSYTTSDTGSGTIYAYTKSGLQEITLRSAKVVFAELTDFLSGSLFEDYDEITDTLSVTDASSSVVVKKVALIGDRYAVISYGIGELTHAMVYDLALKQWGKLKIPHTECFEFIEYPTAVTELPKRNIAFIGTGASINICNTDIGAVESNGVMMVGKFQFARSRFLQLQGVEFENVNQGDTFTLLNLPSLDGKNFEPALSGYLTHSQGKLRVYRFHNTALNHTLVAKGAFTAISIVLTFNVAGGR